MGSLLEGVRAALSQIDGITLTGLSVVGQDARNSVQRQLPRLLGIAAIVVVAWLLVILRSMRLLLLSLVPTVFSMVFVFAVMHITGTKLNIVNLLALPLLVGVGVDDGIFLVLLFAHDPRHVNPRATPQLSACCHAITMTSLTTAIAFGSLLLTSTPAVRSLGTVFAVGILGSWFGSIVFLNALLFFLNPTWNQRKSSNVQTVDS